MEYLEAHPNGYQYTSFCKRYTDWLAKHRLSMRQIHKAGEKLFVDYAGQKPRIVDVKTGEELEVEFFVAVLGASNYTYAEATLSQKSPDFIGSHMRCLEFLGGAPKALVPDPLKSGVTTSCRYEPMPQRTYAEMAAHYQTVVLPARPRKPKDKAKVEVAVQIAERWILARLRNERFHSLVALNQRIRELLEDLNSRPMKTYGGKSRRDLFVALDKPALTHLPATRFVHCRIQIGQGQYRLPHRTGRPLLFGAERARREKRWRQESRRSPSRFSTKANASPPIREVSTKGGTRRTVRTCRRPIAGTPSGVLRG